MRALIFILAVVVASASGLAADYPPVTEADFILKDFHFASGESLPEVRMHYRTIGERVVDKSGVVRNAVLILHGTGGQSGNFVGKGLPDTWFAGELFGKGQPLDATRYFIIIPDNLGHGKSAKSSDGLRAKFPRYGYRDMISAQYR